MNLEKTLQSAVRELAAAGVETPALDARLLLEKALNCTREELLQRNSPLSPSEHAVFEGFISRRGRKEPVAKIIGKREFWSLDFKITHDTLDPRPASESLIEAVLELKQNRLTPYRILDVGTGSGCLIIALLKELPKAIGVGVDISEKAVQIACENAINHGVSERVSFAVNNWTYNLNSTFDIIISNPPYIADAEIASLAEDVRCYDPMTALCGGADGLAAYRILAQEMPRLLNKRGLVVLEIGYTQGEAVSTLLAGTGFSVREVKQDLQGLPRIVVAEKIN